MFNFDMEESREDLDEKVAMDVLVSRCVDNRYDGRWHDCIFDELFQTLMYLDL